MAKRLKQMVDDGIDYVKRNASKAAVAAIDNVSPAAGAAIRGVQAVRTAGNLYRGATGTPVLESVSRAGRAGIDAAGEAMRSAAGDIRRGWIGDSPVEIAAAPQSAPTVAASAPVPAPSRSIKSASVNPIDVMRRKVTGSAAVDMTPVGYGITNSNNAIVSGIMRENRNDPEDFAALMPSEVIRIMNAPGAGQRQPQAPSIARFGNTSAETNDAMAARNDAFNARTNANANRLLSPSIARDKAAFAGPRFAAKPNRFQIQAQNALDVARVNVQGANELAGVQGQNAVALAQANRFNPEVIAGQDGTAMGVDATGRGVALVPRPAAERGTSQGDADVFIGTMKSYDDDLLELNKQLDAARKTGMWTSGKEQKTIDQIVDQIARTRQERDTVRQVYGRRNAGNDQSGLQTANLKPADVKAKIKAANPGKSDAELKPLYDRYGV